MITLSSLPSSGASLKIGYIVPAFPWHSETFIYQEVQGLKDLDLGVVVCALARPKRERLRDMSKTAIQLSRETRYVNSWHAVWRGVLSINRMRQWTPPGLPAQRGKIGGALLLSGRATAIASEFIKAGVRHIHAHWPLGCQLASLVGASTGLSFSMSIHAHETIAHAQFYEVLFERASFAALCNSATMDHLLSQIQPRFRAKGHLVYHGVDTECFGYSPPQSKRDHLQVASAGRLTATKNFDVLIRAIALANAKGPDIRLSLIGDGPERAGLEHLIAECEASHQIRIIGWVPHDSLPDFLSNSDLFVLLADTGYHDGLPNTVLEAMACGRPVVVNPFPAAGEVVAHGHSGYILKRPNDPEELAEVLCRAAEDQTEFEAMGLNARKVIETRLSKRDQIRLLADLFHSVLGR